MRGLLPVFLASFCQPWLYLVRLAGLGREAAAGHVWQPVMLAPSPACWAAPPSGVSFLGLNRHRCMAVILTTVSRLRCVPVSLIPARCPAAPVLQAFGACLQRTRLRTFLWTQPLLLAPMLWTGRSHCSRQLEATPEAARHVARIAAAMRQASTWLPVGPLPSGSLRSGGNATAAAAAAAAAAAEAPQSACLAVHLWLVLVLSFCLPAIVIHRLEGQELQAENEQKQRRQRGSGDNGSGGHGGGSQWSGRAAAPRRLLHQQAPSLPMTAAELLLAGFTAWQVVQVLQLLVG